MRCTSRGRVVSLQSAWMIGAPNVRLGTKRASMTSTCTQSAPPRSMAATSSLSRPGSAARMEGAIRTVTGSPPISIADHQVDAGLARAQHAARGALLQDDPDRALAPGAGGDGPDAEPRALEALPGGFLLQSHDVGHPDVGGAPAHHEIDPGAGRARGGDGRPRRDDDARRRGARDGVHVADPEAGRLHHLAGTVQLER